VNFAVLQAHGYASSIEALRSPDGSRYRIEARDLVECDLLKGRMRGRTSHWFRGMLAGILEASEGGEWEVEEVECVNEGSDKCAFEARRRAPGPPAPGGQ
jgi:Predicted hydrocarbon binding protein (contains V4R domain)